MAEKINVIIEFSIFFLGLISNLIGITTLVLSKKLKKIGTRNIHILLIIVDSLFLIITLADRCSFYNGFDLTTYSIVTCKLYPYLNRILATLSPMLLVNNCLDDIRF